MFNVGFFFYGGWGGPYWYPFWGFDYGPYYDIYSPYYYYGYFPYVYQPRVVVVTQPVYTYSYVPYDDYYLDSTYQSGLQTALDDIKGSWMSSNGDMIASHINPSLKVAISLNGKYSYTLSGKDYGAMTIDAVGKIKTTGFDYYKVDKRSDGAYQALATHQFHDSSGNQKTVYVSYTLKEIDHVWTIVAAGSSNNQLN